MITICPALEEHARQVNGHVDQLMIENVVTEPQDAPSEQALTTFKASQPSLDGKRIVLYAWTFEAYQGIDLLVSNVQRVTGRCKDVQFVLVGRKPAQVENFQSLARARGVAPYCYFTGTRVPQEMPLFVALSEVFVSPRTSGTNMPRKLYSYLPADKPIVATNLQTHNPVLDAGVAVLVDPDPNAVAQGVLSVLEDPQLAGLLGTQARQLHDDNYSFQTFVRKTERVLQFATG